MFRSVDVNGDGEISQQELREYLGSAGYSAQQAGRIFGALDVNSDDSISQADSRPIDADSISQADSRQIAGR